MEKLWDFIVRLRTHLFNGIGAAVVLVAPLLGAPEIQAIIPKGALPYVIAAVFLINMWMRPRPATRAADPEVKVAQALKATDYPATVIVEAGGDVKATIDA